MDAGRVTAAEQLLDVAWDGEPPDSGLRALRFHMSKLRSELGIDGLIVTVGSGYRLDAKVDLVEVQAAANNGGDSEQLQRVLDLWRGQPLAGCSPCSVIEHEQHRLDELKLILTEKLFAARLDNGQASAVIGDLTRICLDHPLREGLWANLVTAHYQAEPTTRFRRQSIVRTVCGRLNGESARTYTYEWGFLLVRDKNEMVTILVRR